MRLFGWMGALVLAASCTLGDPGIDTLAQERTIALPNVSGRIDHLAIDPQHTQLAVAELGNSSIDIIQVDTGEVIARLTGVGEPQGLAFDRTGDLLLAASRKDGALHLFDALTHQPIVVLPLGGDADNVRIDPRTGNAIVGYGDGALAVVDLRRKVVLARIELPAHPESFQIDAATGRVYVNLPDARTIAVVDLDLGEVIERWTLPLALWNYPLALAPSGDALVSVFRAPPRLVQFDRTTGAQTASVSTCGDADDVFYDAVRHRIYVSCGGGGVDVFDSSGPRPKRISHVNTGAGARTALFDPVLDRLFVAARPTGGDTTAAILVFKPID